MHIQQLTTSGAEVSGRGDIYLQESDDLEVIDRGLATQSGDIHLMVMQGNLQLDAAIESIAEGDVTLEVDDGALTMGDGRVVHWVSLVG
ncbi:hypothetical protein ACQZV8_21015 [Magnetococcales bacterium HHB-1]